MSWFSRLFGKKDDLFSDKSFSSEGTLHFKNPYQQDQSDELGLDEKPVILEAQLSSPSNPSFNMSSNMYSAQSSPTALQRELELINSKLDTLKAILNSMEQRLTNLEKAAGVQQKRMPW